MNLNVIFDGGEEPKTRPADLKVEDVIKSLLPEGEKQHWDQYVLSKRSRPLDPGGSLVADGVKEGDTISLTKKQKESRSHS